MLLPRSAWMMGWLVPSPTDDPRQDVDCGRQGKHSGDACEEVLLQIRLHLESEYEEMVKSGNYIIL
jgi:hypothetical protein